MITALGTKQARYFTVVAEGLLDEDGTVLYHTDQLENAQQRRGEIRRVGGDATGIEFDRRVASAKNLSEIAKACHKYADLHDRKFPPTLQVLVEMKLITPEVLISPRDPSLDGCSYEYIAGQTENDDSRNVLAHEPLYNKEGACMVFLLGDAEWASYPVFQMCMKETHERLRRPFPP